LKILAFLSSQNHQRIENREEHGREFSFLLKGETSNFDEEKLMQSLIQTRLSKNSK